MGSQLGLKHLLLTNYPEKTVYVVGDEPKFFSFMEDAVMDEIPDAAYENALAVILDCGAAHLISDKRYTLAAATARLDHHIFTGTLAQATSQVDTVADSFKEVAGAISNQMILLQQVVDTGKHALLDAAATLYTIHPESKE